MTDVTQPHLATWAVAESRVRFLLPVFIDRYQMGRSTIALDLLLLAIVSAEFGTQQGVVVSLADTGGAPRVIAENPSWPDAQKNLAVR
jgi:hypothetical protein